MKKVFTTLLVLLFITNLKAQSDGGTTVPIVKYQIDTIGYSNGLPLPVPHFIGVNNLGAEVMLSLGGISLQVTSVTCIDSILSNNFHNDSLATFTMYPMTTEESETMAIPLMISAIFEARLREIYGINNVIKL